MIDHLAEQIRAALVPSIAKEYPWSEMPLVQREAYHDAARAVVAAIEASRAPLALVPTSPGVKRPNIVDYVEDRDLWRFKLPLSR